MSDRFYVYESSGITVRPQVGLHGYDSGKRSTFFHIFDRAYCHREVGRHGCSSEAWTYCHTDLTQARRRAERHCAELNAWAEGA